MRSTTRRSNLVATPSRRRLRIRPRLTPQGRKDLLWNDTKGLCAYCGQPIERSPKIGGTVEHVHPQSRGGGSERGNIVLACVPCNKDKADDTVIDWFLRRRSAAAAYVLLASRAAPWLLRTAAEIAQGPYADETPVSLPVALQGREDEFMARLEAIRAQNVQGPTWEEQLGGRVRWPEPFTLHRKPRRPTLRQVIDHMAMVA